MMKKAGFVIYMLVGATLMVSGFATTERGLKENNREMLYKVAEDYEELGDMGFKGFCPLDYKVAFSDSEKDVVVSYDGGECNYTKRDAVYGGLVGSIYQDGDEFEVVVPEYDTWITLEAVNNEPLSAVIWHEGFHAYQNSYHKLYEKTTQNVLSETELSEIADSDNEAKRLFSKEMEVLSRIFTDENSGDVNEIAIEYSKIAKERRGLLSEQVNGSEDFYLMMEGSAYYVESLAVRYENGEETYQKEYLGTASKYVDGNAKYYRLGMLECMLLDKLDPEWKNSYSFDRTFEEVIDDYIS
ncbi:MULTISPECIES: hypothetical protein [unclassified Butyrivibrio]|uniref:hypothetical protein n=1 Tax=unclassified Butyrivibrio TaxID=2639466 RepID=UPI0003B707F5|nr:MULTISPECIES: hypothetical protein [unclassified Butyrivibrio]